MRRCEICASSGITLVALLVPIAFGIYFKHRWPNAAKKILKVCGQSQILRNLMHDNICRALSH